MLLPNVSGFNVAMIARKLAGRADVGEQWSTPNGIHMVQLTIEAATATCLRRGIWNNVKCETSK